VYLDEPDSFDIDLARYLDASSEDLRSAAATWLGRDRAISLAVVPQGRADLAPPDAEPVRGVA
jgi:hypothetical protein